MNGTFAEYGLADPDYVGRLPQQLEFGPAAPVLCAGVTVYKGLKETEVRPGEWVAVSGVGGLGHMAVQYAKAMGMNVVAADIFEDKLELARKMGATDTLNAREVDPVAAVKDLTSGGVHYSFEAIGAKATAEQCFFMLRPGGAATIIGMIPVAEKVEIPGHAFLQERKLQGSMMGSNRFRVDMPRFVDLYLDRRLDLDSLISARISLEQVNDGFAAMKTGEVARSVVVFGG